MIFNNIDNTFVVVYKIQGFEGEFRAGPYLEDDITYQRNDIASYNKVYDVRIEPANVSKERCANSN